MDTPFFHIGTTKLSASDTATRGTLAGDGNRGDQILIYNDGPDMAYVDVGDSSVSATVPTSAGTGSLPIPPQLSISVFNRSVPQDTHVSAICDAGNTATVYISVGNGV